VAAEPVDVTQQNALAHLDFLAGVAGAQSPEPTISGREPHTQLEVPEAGNGPGFSMSFESVESILEAIPEVRAALYAADDTEVLEVSDRTTFTAAGGTLARLKKGERAASEYKKNGRIPLVEEVKLFDRACQGIISKLAEAGKMLNDKMTKWRQAEEVLNAQLRTDAAEAAQQLQEQLAAKARAAGVAEPPQVEVYVAPPPKTVDIAPEDGGGRVTVTSRWTYEVENAADVPREYCEPSAGLLRKAVNDGTRTIPGVRIFQQDTAGYRTS